MAAADKATIKAGTPGMALMERAGRAVADAVRGRFPGAAVSVLCGPGNNGGDGFVAARLLAEHGHEVSVACTQAPTAYQGDAAVAAGRWQGPCRRFPDWVPEQGVVVDALFGAGLNADLPDDIDAALQSIAAHGLPVIAVDMPSGIDGDSGRCLGHVLSCAATVTFCRRKPAHLLFPARARCGEVITADIGIADEAIETSGFVALANHPSQWIWPDSRADWSANKYTRGQVVVFAGAMAGAARLAAIAAARIGAGITRCLLLPAADSAAFSALPASIIVESHGAEARDLPLKADYPAAVVVGPGLTIKAEQHAWLIDMVEAAADGDYRLILDAGALAALSEKGELAALNDNCILTPHEGEFARLFPDLSQGSKLERTRAAAARAGCTVLLKGPDTVIAGPGGSAVINETGRPSLATAGTGDVLAGMIAGLAARGLDVFSAGCAAAWMHGKAAEILDAGASRNLMADDLPSVFKAIESIAREISGRDLSVAKAPIDG